MSDSLAVQAGDPLQCFQRWDATPGSVPERLLLVEFELPQYWLEGAPSQPLTAIYCIDAQRLRIAVTERELVADGSAPARQFEQWLAQHELLAVAPGQALELLPCRIPKPWGQEIWFTGVELRGVCRVSGAGGEVPLPWLQAVLPGGSAGTASDPLLLLKVLDPSPRPVLGDLYFELHQSKREAYVVTHVDPRAWPDGVGYIRYGFAREKLAASPDEQAFRNAYLEAVRAYEAVRRELDGMTDKSQVGAELLSREQLLRQEMDSFSYYHPLRAGDVLVVPPGLPHGLLHGVRAIEFQTPVYERRILSFAQQVLTQAQWDTDQAVPHMLLTAPAEVPVSTLVEGEGVRVEQIVDFTDFEVRRLLFESGCGQLLEIEAQYAVMMIVQGATQLDGNTVVAGQAILLPLGWRGFLACANPAQPLVFLLAQPRC